MNVSQVMTEAVVTESADDSLAEAAARMHEQQTGSLLVMEDERLVGIFTERDLLKAVARGLDPKHTQVREVMTKDVETIDRDMKLIEAAALMASRWIRHLPVLEGGKVVGLISQRDLAGVFSQVLEEPERSEPLQGEQLARSTRLKRIEAGDLD